MDPRMAAREWFLDKPGDNKYDIEVHVQRSFWHNGFGEAFFRCTRAEPPYRCSGIWRGQEIELEWVPRNWLSLHMQEFDEDMVDGVSRVIRLEPSLRYATTGAQNGQPPAAHDAEAGEGATEAGEEPNVEDEDDAGAEERIVVEWRVRNVEERLRELTGQAGVRGVRQM